MLSNSNSRITRASNRKPPTCTRCRNHGIFNVQLKGHRNVCKYRLCTCKNCILIVQRRLMVVKPDRDHTESGGKTSKKKRSSKKMEAPEKKNDGEGLINNQLQTAITHGKGDLQIPVFNLEALNSREVPIVKHSSASLPREQARLLPAPPPSPYYGFMYRSVPMGMRSFNPSNPPNVTMASPRASGPSGMMIPIPDQPHILMNFPATRPRGFAINTPPLNVTIPRPMEHF